MTRLGPRSTAAMILALCLSSIASAGDKFNAYMNAALQNEQSERGKRYSPAFEKEHFAGFAERLNVCAQKTGGPHSDPFDLLLKLGATGRVEKILARPENPFSNCVAELTKKVAFPGPPSPGYWVLARMRFSEGPR